MKYYLYETGKRVTVHEGIQGLLAFMEKCKGEITIIKGEVLFQANIQAVKKETP